RVGAGAAIDHGRVATSTAFDDDAIVGFRIGNRDACGKTGDIDGPTRRSYGDRVVAYRSIGDQLISRTVAAATVRPKDEVDLSETGAAHIVDGDDIDAAQRAKRNRLDAVQVHGDAGNVAGEADASAIRRNVDSLGDIGAIEQQRVGAGLALDDV